MNPLIISCGGRVSPEESRRRLEDRDILTQLPVLDPKAS